MPGGRAVMWVDAVASANSCKWNSFRWRLQCHRPWTVELWCTVVESPLVGILVTTKAEQPGRVGAGVAQPLVVHEENKRTKPQFAFPRLCSSSFIEWNHCHDLSALFEDNCEPNSCKSENGGREPSLRTDSSGA